MSTLTPKLTFYREKDIMISKGQVSVNTTRRLESKSILCPKFTGSLLYFRSLANPYSLYFDEDFATTEDHLPKCKEEFGMRREQVYIGKEVAMT